MHPTKHPATQQSEEGTSRLWRRSLLRWGLLRWGLLRWGLLRWGLLRWGLLLFLAALLLGGCTTLATPAADAGGYLVEYVGRVTDATSRRGIAGAKVVLEFAGAPPIVYTDDEGIFRFQVRSAGPLLSGRVRVEAEGYAIYDRNIDVNPSAPQLEDIRLAQQTAALPTPTPTPTPLDADILIAEFDARHATRSLEIGRRLEQDLERQLRTYGLDNVVIKVLDQSVGDDEQATDLARSMGSRAVIWGWYDDLGVSVSILLADPDAQAQEVPGIYDLPLTLGGDPAAELAFVIRQVLPDNVSFLSLFVIGHLYYTNNDYAKGRAAFDAAMANLPENVAFENRAILHFFRARQMEARGSKDYDTIICEYIAAIEKDPSMAEAYNNLGVLLYQHFYRLYGVSTWDLDAGRVCLESAGLDPNTLFDQALALRPTWIVPRYNQLAVTWDTKIGSVNAQEYKTEIESLLAADPTLSGAYIILGLLEAAGGNFAAAEEHLMAGLARVPSNQAGSVHSALGLVYLGQGEYGEAEAHFQQALARNPEDTDARFGLAVAAYALGSAQEALGLLDAIESDLFSEVDEMALILRSRAAFDAGDPAQAAGLLDEWLAQNSYDNPVVGSTAFLHYLAGLLQTAAGDSDATQSHFAHGILVQQLETEIAAPGAAPGAGPAPGSPPAINTPTLTRSWSALADRCAASWQANPGDLQSVLLTDPCLPTELSARITALYDIWQAELAKRFFDVEVVLGAACPFVFTYDEELRTWLFDTTILYKLVGPQSEQLQMRPLARFDGRLLVREVEPETSYLDFLTVVGVGHDGEVTAWLPAPAELQAGDGVYAVLEQGDELLVELAPGAALPPLFGDIALDESLRDAGGVQWWVLAEGYYVPYPAAAEQSAGGGDAP